MVIYINLIMAKMHFSSLHFGSIPILIPKLISLQISSLEKKKKKKKKKKKIVFKMVHAVNPLIETSYVANSVPFLLTWPLKYY